MYANIYIYIYIKSTLLETLIYYLSLSSGTAEEPYRRLPDNVRPIHYTLEIAIFTNNTTTRGEVVIYLEILRTTDNITLHASELLTILRERVRVSEREDPSWKEVEVRRQSDEKRCKKYATVRPLVV